MSISVKDGIAQSAKARTHRIVEAIKNTIIVVTAEIKDAEGIYPHNAGRLTMAEVCRRAGVHPITMMGKAHRDTTRPMILAWMNRIELARGATAVRSAVTKRADTAKEEYRRIAGEFQAMYQVEIPRHIEEIMNLKAQVAKLEDEKARLQEAVSQGRVVRLTRRGTKHSR
jgi:hypothetical protein